MEEILADFPRDDALKGLLCGCLLTAFLRLLFVKSPRFFHWNFCASVCHFVLILVLFEAVSSGMATRELIVLFALITSTSSWMHRRRWWLIALLSLVCLSNLAGPIEVFDLEEISARVVVKMHDKLAQSGLAIMVPYENVVLNGQHLSLSLRSLVSYRKSFLMTNVSATFIQGFREDCPLAVLEGEGTRLTNVFVACAHSPCALLPSGIELRNFTVATRNDDDASYLHHHLPDGILHCENVVCPSAVVCVHANLSPNADHCARWAADNAPWFVRIEFIWKNAARVVKSFAQFATEKAAPIADIAWNEMRNTSANLKPIGLSIACGALEGMYSPSADAWCEEMAVANAASTGLYAVQIFSRATSRVIFLLIFCCSTIASAYADLLMFTFRVELDWTLSMGSIACVIAANIFGIAAFLAQNALYYGSPYVLSVLQLGEYFVRPYLWFASSVFRWELFFAERWFECVRFIIPTDAILFVLWQFLRICAVYASTSLSSHIIVALLQLLLLGALFLNSLMKQVPAHRFLSAFGMFRFTYPLIAIMSSNPKMWYVFVRYLFVHLVGIGFVQFAYFTPSPWNLLHTFALHGYFPLHSTIFFLRFFESASGYRTISIAFLLRGVVVMIVDLVMSQLWLLVLWIGLCGALIVAACVL